MKPLTYATVCSGIECMSVAVRGLPLRPVFFSEVEPYPCAVLRYRYPDVPNLGDMTKIEIDNERKVITNGRTIIPIPDGGLDILAGGTPCQDFSVAGLRRGADGDNCDDGGTTRSSLCFNFIRLLRGLQPRYFVYENVAGMLTSNEGRDFAHFLVALGQSGYCDVSWRVLDAQYVRVDGMERAVPQRRRRVWVVGCLGAAQQRSAQILLEPGRMCGDSAPRRKTSEEVAASLGGRASVHDPLVGKVSGVSFDEFHQFPVTSDNTTTTIVNGTSAGYHNGVIHDRVSGIDAFNHATTGNVSMTITGHRVDPHSVSAVVEERKATNGHGENVSATISADDITQSGQGYVNNSVVVRKEIVTNSNGGDVMPTIRACECKQVDSMKDIGGGYVCSRLLELRYVRQGR